MDLKEAHIAENSRHPWELARFAFFHKQLRNQGGLSDCTEILDIGAGDAWFSKQLSKHNSQLRIDCVDINYSEQSSANLGIDPNTLSLHTKRPDRKYKIILMLDILEHIEDDTTFLSEIIDNNLAPGGKILISVPAWQSLHSAHDRWLQHFRRYRPSEFDRLLETTKLESSFGGGLFHSLLVPRALGVLREKVSRASFSKEEPQLQWNAGPMLTNWVSKALSFDNWLSQKAAQKGLRVPGLTLWALCQKQS